MAFFFFCPVLCSPVKSHNRCSVISLYKKAEMKERNFVKSETWIKAQSMVRINSSYFLHICYDMIPSCTDYRCNLPISLCFGVGLVCMGKQQASIHIWITDFLKNNKSLFPEKKGSLIFFFSHWICQRCWTEKESIFGFINGFIYYTSVKLSKYFN